MNAVNPASCVKQNDPRTRVGRQSLSNSEFPQEKGRAGRGIRAEKKVRECAPARADPAKRPEPCGKIRGVIITKHNNVCDHATV